MGQGAVGGRAGHRQIAGDGLRGVLAQLGDVRGDGARVPARDGAGEGRVAGAQGVVQGGAQQRAEHPVGGLDTGRAQELHGLGDQGDQVVGAQGEGRVIERAALLGDPLGLAAHLDHQGLGGQPQFLGRGDPEGASGEPLDVHRSARERHRGVQGQRQRADPQSGVQDLRAVPPGGVHEQLPGAYGPGVGEALDEPGQGVVRDGQQHQVRALQHLRGRDHWHVREHQRGPPPGRVRHPGDGHRAVPGQLERGGQRGAHPAGADDTDGEPRGAVLGLWLLECTHATAAFPFQSAPGTGRFLVMLTRSVREASGCPQAVGCRTAAPYRKACGNPGAPSDPRQASSGA